MLIVIKMMGLHVCGTYTWEQNYGRGVGCAYGI